MSGVLGPVFMEEIYESIQCVNSTYDLCEAEGIEATIIDPPGGIDISYKLPAPPSPRTKDFSIFPNPAQQEVHLDFSQFLNQSALIRIYSLQGQLMEERIIDELGPSPISFDVKKYRAGYYLASVLFDGKTLKTAQFIVGK